MLRSRRDYHIPAGVRKPSSVHAAQAGAAVERYRHADPYRIGRLYIPVAAVASPPENYD